LERRVERLGGSYRVIVARLTKAPSIVHKIVTILQVTIRPSYLFASGSVIIMKLSFATGTLSALGLFVVVAAVGSYARNLLLSLAESE
jgi:hypothetical protein